MVTPTAEDVLEMSFISYSTPLDLARRWLQSGDRDERQEAKKLLEGLIGRYPHSLDIGQHLALCYLESEEEERARRILERMSLLSRNPNEEILARGGRVYRDQGDRYVKWQDDDSDRNAELQALRLYRQALQEYEKAYLVRSGHYPGINVATLHLLIAAIEPDEGQQTSHLEESKKVAHELLNDRAKWPSEYPDDPVWHAATQGEARLLLRIRTVEDELSEPLAVMADLCGPKIRVGPISGGSVLLADGQELAIQRDPLEGRADRISTTLA
ncbi:MAG: tetratricopeptide repeat-containing protein, partial [Pirellulaceae bacterium]